MHKFSLRILPDPNPIKPNGSWQTLSSVSSIQNRSWPSAYLHVSNHPDAEFTENVLNQVLEQTHSDPFSDFERTQNWIKLAENMDDPNSLDLAKGIEDADSLNEQNISNPFDKHASWASTPSSVAESHKSVTQDTGLHLLSIDNGGVRGLSALIILEQLMDAVDPDAPPEPYEWFNMIGGTGTGG